MADTAFNPDKERPQEQKPACEQGLEPHCHRLGAVSQAPDGRESRSRF